MSDVYKKNIGSHQERERECGSDLEAEEQSFACIYRGERAPAISSCNPKSSAEISNRSEDNNVLVSE